MTKPGATDEREGGAQSNAEEKDGTDGVNDLPVQFPPENSTHNGNADTLDKIRQHIQIRGIDIDITVVVSVMIVVSAEPFYQMAAVAMVLVVN